MPPKISLSRNKIDFGIVKKGQTKSKSFQIHCEGRKVKLILGWIGNPDWVKATVTPDPNSSSKFSIKITVKIDKGASLGSHQDTILVLASGNQVAIVPVSAIIKRSY